MGDFTKLDRHTYIFKKILRKENINTTQIAEYLNTSRKTIERDLKEDFSSIFEAPIEYINGKWYIPNFIMDIRSYNTDELVIITSLLNKLEKDNMELYSKTIELFGVLNEKVSHTIYKQSSIEDILATHKNEFYLIKSAIEDTKEIKFKFHSYDKYVQPLKIANLEKYWYLLCFDLDSKIFSKYPLKGIHSIEVQDIIFNLEEHTYMDKLDNAINAFFDIDKEIDVVLELDWDAKKVLSRVKLNSSQEIIKTDDKKFVMNITISNLMEIIPIIQQWIPHIKVISPIELKDKIKENLGSYQI